MSAVAAIADAYVDDYASLDPCTATDAGIAGHDHELTDYSPAGAEERADRARRAVRDLDAAAPTDDADVLAAAVMRNALETELARHDAGEHLRSIGVLGTEIQGLRQCFDLMATDTTDDWVTIARRLEALPTAVAQLTETFEEGRRVGTPAARRQALGCAQQCFAWAGADGTTSYFHELVSVELEDRALRARLDAAADGAAAAYAQLGAYLSDTYAPDADERDGVGEERYRLLARGYLGTEIDPTETYAWGWEELGRIEQRMAEVAAQILPDASIDEVIDHLNGPDGPAITGEDALVAWIQDLLDSSIAVLDGAHFDIPEPVRTVEAKIAPPGGPAAQYYTPPTEDFSRPGRYWYPTLGHERFPIWREPSICYHEGVPGHHLQVAQVVYNAQRLNRFQRLLAWSSGHGEGWALYAERLMGELGFLEDPAHELGMLSAHAMRAARVVVDIGMHLSLPIPDDVEYHPGERWTAELAVPFMVAKTGGPPDTMASEVDRYLGIPGQAISYKVGERVWLAGREAARRRHGADFDLKAFHSYALDLGNMDLALLELQLDRF